MPTARKKRVPEDSEWMSLADAARALDESRLSVLTRAVKGEVTAKHIAGRTIVSRESVDTVLAEKSE